MNQERNYYVYKHIRNDDNTCIYVGKGHGKRATCRQRNERHDAIMNEVGITIRIIQDGLTEDEAFDLEHATVLNYVFELGYSIDIDGYRDENNPKFLTNKTFGGKGYVGLERPNHSKCMKGGGNPMYGVNVWEMYSDEKAKEVKDKISLAVSGENNAMFNVSPKDRMDEETYKKWFQKTSDRCKEQVGSKNPNSKTVYVYDHNMCFVSKFDCIKDCANWIKEHEGLKSGLETIASSIGQSIIKSKPYKTYHFHRNPL